MKQQPYVFQPGNGENLLPYLLALPKAYGQDSGQRWPLLLFLHGRGERGSDLALLKKYGIPHVVETWQDTPFVTVSPQCPETSNWEAQVDTLAALLDDISARYTVDTRRIYLTGLSMGGRGSWRLSALYPERFAAIVPVCGRIPDLPDFFAMLAALKQTPIWVFHGAKDPVVPIENSEKMVAALQALGGNVRFTVYPEAGHDSWGETYANPELYRWLQQQVLTTSELHQPAERAGQEHVMYQQVTTDLRTAYDRKVDERAGRAPESWKVEERGRFLALLQEEGKRTLLEIGAGPGHDGLFFQENGLEVTCTDLSPVMVQYCRGRGLNARVMDFANLAFPPESFDAIYAQNCLLHAPKTNFPGILERLRGLLKSGGLFFLGQYGGVDREGVWEHDHYEPKRFYARYLDDQILALVKKHFAIVSFRRILLEEETAGHFQSLILRK